jgi:hypothetical protein
VLGAVAQLGERLNGIQEADGSIPFSSTNKFRGSGSGELLDPFPLSFYFSNLMNYPPKQVVSEIR